MKIIRMNISELMIDDATTIILKNIREIIIMIKKSQLAKITL